MKSFSVGNLNEDKLPEIVLAIDAFVGEQVTMLVNKGSSNFEKKIIFSDKYEDVTNVEIGDLNKDGKNDLVILNFRDIIVGVNNGTLQFSDKVLISTSNGYYLSTFITDITGEGEKDLVIGTSIETIWLKNIKSDLTFQKQLFSKANGVFRLLDADFNKDGAMDFAEADFDMRVFRNTIIQTPSNVSDIQYRYTIFPNPAVNEINIEGITNESLSVTFYNFAGMMIFQNTVVDSKVNIHLLRAGQYIMTIHDKDGKLIGSEKIIKQ